VVIGTGLSGISGGRGHEITPPRSGKIVTLGRSVVVISARAAVAELLRVRDRLHQVPEPEICHRHFIHHLIAPPQLHEINRDKVVSGVIGHAEFNDAIPIVIGHQEQSQKCEFMCLYLIGAQLLKL
jgi:hypothetical protein